jgi:hypothetical protein
LKVEVKKLTVETQRLETDSRRVWNVSQPELNELQQSLDAAQPTTPEQAEAVAELKEHVEKAQTDSAHHATLRERLQARLVLFEDGHPQLNTAMQSAINTLSLGGI